MAKQEKLIINGVNVAGCMFLCKNTAGHICCGDDIREDKIPFANFCQENKDCYYKQLQGIKQQNLEIIERANAYPKIVILANERLNKIARLEQENKELKEQLLEDKILDEHIESLSQEDIYRSALEEIRGKYKAIKPQLLNCLKFINDIRINVCLDDIELHNLDCKNCENKIKRFYELYEEYFKKDFDIYAEIKKLKEEENEQDK